MSSVKIKHGAEGPSHDPYSYDEITVLRDNGNVTKLHEGLGVWLEHNGRRVDICATSSDLRGVDLGRAMYLEYMRVFEVLSGISPRVAERAHHYATVILPHKLHRMRCDGDVYATTGYPGESFVCCEKCNFVADYGFNISEVE
jgi:hypothetical protein